MQMNLVPILSDRANWLLPCVEAVTAVMCSAAPLKFKIRASCSSFVDHSMASGAWLMQVCDDEISILENHFEDEEIKTILSNVGLNEILIRRIRQISTNVKKSQDTIIVRSFDALGFERDFVAAPMVISGKVVGIFACLFRVESKRSDIELQAVKIIARIMSISLSERLENSPIGYKSNQSKKANEAIILPAADSRPLSFPKDNKDCQIKSSHDDNSRLNAIFRCLPGSVVIFNKHGELTQAMNSAETSKSPAFREGASQEWIFDYENDIAFDSQNNALKKALMGEDSTCQFRVGDWSDSENSNFVIEQSFHVIKDLKNEVVEVIGYTHDITDKLSTQAAIRELVELRGFLDHDAITHCMSFSAFKLHAENQIADQNQINVPIIFFTIDIQKSGAGINLIGQSSFEELLMTAVARIRRQLPTMHSIARRGDQSFLVMVRLDDAQLFAEKIAQKIVLSLKEPILTGQHECFISTNVGYSIFPLDGGTLDEMIYNSDIAALAAGVYSGNKPFAFLPSMARQASDRVRLETALHRAVDHEEFRLAYQPKIDLGTGKVNGVEALIRWPGRNNLSPAFFIPVAEDCGLICLIGEWTLRHACATAAGWASMGLRMPVSVNVSTRQFHEVNFNAIVKDILRETSCDPELLEIEVTEGVMIRDPKAVMESFKDLKKIGIKLSIDDFGTGYSSLAYLKELAVDKLKIDRAFVMGLPHDPDSEAIAKAILAMAKAMGLRTVAEGVEDLACLNHLKSMGCDEIQGYFFSKPLFEKDFLAWYDSYEVARKKIRMDF